jgi:hypothetical protein
MPNRIIDGRDHPIDRNGLYKPVIGILITIMVAFIYYHIGERSFLDQASTLIVAFSFIQATIVVVVFTEDWKWRIVGILIALGGTGLAYAFLYGNATGHTNINTLYVRSALRSALTVGGTILAIGTWAYLYRRHRHGEKIAEGFIDPRDNYHKGAIE